MKNWPITLPLLFCISTLFAAENKPKPDAYKGDTQTAKPSKPELPAKAPVADKKAPAEKPTKGRPADAKPFGKHFYKVFKERISWHDARKKCEAMGGHLVCIETKEEQKFIAELAADKYYYLGATDEKKEDEWKWINGSKWEFTQWMDGQPNNWSGKEHYLATYDGGEWVDVAAKGRGFWMPIGFICEWDK